MTRIILECIGGLGLFLFGIFFLNEALKKLLGKRLREILMTLTKSPVRGVCTGFFVTLLNQASSATTVLEVSLVNAGLLTFYQSMAVTMGAEIGSTMTAQLIAFKISNYAILITGLGFYISFFSKNVTRRQFGDMIFGIGIIFLGMKLMTETVMPLKSYAPFISMISSLENPLFGILAGIIITAFVRSSGVTVGILIAIALAGGISLKQAVPVVFGAEIGTCFTALIASIGNGREGERVALWHFVHQLGGVIIVFPILVFFKISGEPAWLYIVESITSLFSDSADISRQIAMSHTSAAVLNAIVFLPFIGFFNKLLCKILPPLEEEKPFGPMYIDDGLLETPSIALEQAKKEIVREAEIVFEMTVDITKISEKKDLSLLETISLKEIHADVLRNRIVPYLVKVGQKTLNEEQSKQETKLLFIVDYVESIGDIIDKNILPLMKKKLKSGLWFSDEGWADILEFHTKVKENMYRAITAFKENNSELAKLAVDSKPEIDLFHAELHKKHINRLHLGLQESLETSGMHLDLIDHLRNINSHAVSICVSVLGKV